MNNGLKVRMDNLLLNYIIIMAMFANYVEHAPIWYTGFIGLFCLQLLSSKKGINGFKNIILLVVLEVILLFLSGISSKSNEYIFSNSINIIIPMLIIVSLSILFSKDKDRFKQNIFSKIKLFNTWWIINIVILIVQIMGTPLFIKASWLIQNPLYKDLCCGLFGYNRTHELALFTCMIFVCNLSYMDRLKGNKRMIFIVYTIISQVLMLVCSVFNDNVALFILLPVTLVIYIIFVEIKKKNRIIKKVWNYLKYVLLLAIIIWVVLKIPTVKQVFDDYIMVRINAIVNYQTVGVVGSNERSAIIEYAFGQKTTWFWGSGIGNESMGEHVAHGFRHFGLNSMGAFIYQCGIWCFIVHIMICTHSLCVFLNLHNKLEIFMSKIIIMAFILLLSFYSPILISSASMIWVCLIFAYIGGMEDIYE